MKLFFDCSNGISSDMVLKALNGLGASPGHVVIPQCSAKWREIEKTLKGLDISSEAKDMAISIYSVIARAEAEVHGETLDTVHFHEVARPQAIENIVSVAVSLTKLGPDEIIVSPIHDGHGQIKCSHGIISVPVPAVEAMKKYCDYEFVQDAIETEMVTPSGLAVLIGAGARSGKKGSVIRSGTGKGTRDIGRGGLTVSITE